MKMNRKKIITFILFTYGFSCIFWGRQALNYNFNLGWHLSKWNHILGGLGPFFGAIMTTLLFDQWAGVRQYFQQKLFTFTSAKWLLVGFGMPVVFFLIPFLLLGIFQGEWGRFSDIGINSKVPLTNTFPIWLMWCCFYGLGEEGGWRGFLFPEFCQQYKARLSTLYTAMIWVPWHLPVFFYDKDFQSMGIISILGWIVGLVFGSLLLGWLVKQSQWSLWAVILWHGTFNLFTTSDLINPLYPGIMSALVILIVLWIARRYGEDLDWSTAPK